MTFLLDPLTVDNLIGNMWGPSNENFPGWKFFEFGGGGKLSKNNLHRIKVRF